jgi:hypothetical protein
MTVSELRALPSQRGLSNVGAKKDLVERLATVAAGAMEEAQEERHAGAFQDSSPTSLDTAAFSMAAAEESTPVDSTMMRLARSVCVGFYPLQLSLHNLLVQEAFWRGGGWFLGWFLLVFRERTTKKTRGVMKPLCGEPRAETSSRIVTYDED